MSGGTGGALQPTKIPEEIPFAPKNVHREAPVVSLRRMNYARGTSLTQTASRVSDALWVTYRWMAAGLGLTGVVAMLVASSPAALELVVGNRIVFYGLLFAQLGLVMAFSPVAQRASTAATAAMFFTYAALTGATLSVVFLVYTAASIATVFFVTAGSFAGL